MDARSKAESAFSEWALRVEDGEALDFDEVIAAHPELETELRRLHADWKLFAPVLGNVVPGLISDESGLVMPSLSHDADDDEAASSDDLFERLGIHIPSEGRYRFRSVIGRGGGGVVLKVWDAKLKRPVAMKVVLGRGEDRPTGLTPKIDSRSLSRFIDEASIASQLNHPGIVPVHELGSDDDGRAFFTMKLVKGHDLTRVFAQAHAGEDGWSTTRALGVMLRVCEAMAYAHDKGVIHRDLKPANVMVGPYGDVQVMDWGLARVLGQPDRHDLRPRRDDGSPASVVKSMRRSERETGPESSLVTMDGSILGTPCYMAPEQARGDVEAVGPKADVYAVGAMLYHLLAGHPPYYPPGERLPADVILSNLLHGPPRPLAEMSQRLAPELVAIADKALQRNPDERYASMQALADDLRAALEGRVVRAYETGTWAETKTWVKRNKALAGSVMTALVVATALAIALGASRSELATTVDEVTEANARIKDERDVATWRSWLATAVIDAPDDAALRAMIVREVPETATDPWLARRSVEVSAGTYHRGVTLRGHAGPVIDAAWSPDDRQIVTISEDGTARVWNADGTGDGRVFVELEPNRTFEHVAWSPRGDRIATTSNPDPYSDVTENVARVRTLDGANPKSIGLGDVWINSIAWSPDGEKLAIGTSNRVVGSMSTAKVWNLDTGATQNFDHPGSVNSVDWRPDGSSLLTACEDGIVRIWDADGTNTPRVLIGHTASVVSAAWSADGAHVLSGSDDGTARVWSPSELRGTLVLEHDSGVDRALWSPTGQLIYTISATDESDVVRAWTVGGDLHASHTFDSAWKMTIAAGNRIAITDDTDSWTLWTPDLAHPIRVGGHDISVSTARASPNGRRILTASHDGTARIWNTEGESEPLALGGGTEMSEPVCKPAAWSPDGASVLTADSEGTAIVFDTMGTSSPVRLHGHERSVFSLAWSPNGAHFVTASISSILRLWKTSTPSEPTVFTGEDDHHPNFIVTNSNEVTFSGQHDFKLTYHGGSFTISESRLPISPLTWSRITPTMNSAAWSPDGQQVLVSVFDDTDVRIWTPSTPGPPLHLRGHGSLVCSAAWSPDGQHVATASHDHTARVWDLTDVSDSTVLEGHSGLVEEVAWHPDGDGLLTASWDGTARVWDIDGTLRDVLRGHEDDVHSAAWSPDGRWILTASDDHTARLWNADDGSVYRVLRGHRGPVLSATWSPDGRQVATASLDGTARVWDAHSGIERGVLRGHEGAVLSASWSPPDGKRLLTASLDGSVRVWTLDWPLLRARLWDVIDDLLSPEERVRYLGETAEEALAEYQRQKAERDARIAAR